MKTITVIKPNDIKIVELDKPQITKPTEVLVKICASGICGSDIHVLHGNNPFAKYPVIIGHEASGIIEDIGEEVKHLNKGDGVVFEPITYCGKCYACRTGHHNVCKELKVLGCIVNGTFSEYRVVDSSQVYKFDTNKINYIQATMCEPYTIGLHANDRGKVKLGDTVLVHGAGPIGLIVADIAITLGATVIISEPNEKRLKLAQEFGIDYIINPLEEDITKSVMNITKDEGVNVVFEAAGIPSLLQNAIEILSVAGRLVPMTFSKEPSPIDFKAVNAKELTILGTRHQYQKFDESVKLVETKLDKINKLVTHVIPFKDYEKAFEILENKLEDVCKVVLDFNS